jgi:hypothetical protein
MTLPHTVVRILLRKRSFIPDGSRSSVGVPFLRSLNNRTVELYICEGGDMGDRRKDRGSTFVMDPLEDRRVSLYSIA